MSAWVLHFSPTAYTPALLLPFLYIPIAPWNLVQLKYSPKLSAAYNFEWAGMEKEEKQLKFIPSFDEYTTSLRPHVSSLSHVTTVFKNSFYSQHQGLHLFLGNFWFSKQNKCQSDVLSSNDDFCCVKHYLLQHSPFIPLWNKGLKTFNVRHMNSSVAERHNTPMMKIMCEKNLGWFQNLQWSVLVITAFHSKILQLNTTACQTELQHLECTDRLETKSKVPQPPKWWQLPSETPQSSLLQL